MSNSQRRAAYIKKFRLAQKKLKKHPGEVLPSSLLDSLDACKDDASRRILLGITRKGPTGYRGMYDLSYTRKQP